MERRGRAALRQSVVIRGQLLPSANAPGGWALVRTFENMGDEHAHLQLEECVTSQQTNWASRLTPSAKVELSRTQTFYLAPHEKRSSGIYLTPELGARITARNKVEAIPTRC